MYARDREWADRFLPTLRQLIGRHLLEPSSLEQDRQEVCDLVVLRARDVTIGCRVRRMGYRDRYPNQFTIRSRRDTGAVTELRKIVDGWGDWLFYGHALDDAEIAIDPWWLIDLSAFRAQLTRHHYELAHRRPGFLRFAQQSNGDGTHFHWFDIASFKAEPKLLIAAS